jgi:ferrous iron transport protein A
MTLTDLALNHPAKVMCVTPTGPEDVVAARLSELGFVKGEDVRVVGFGPFGRDPLLVQIGFTRFALRRREAARIEVAAQ